jgi:hypothetical protein
MEKFDPEQPRDENGRWVSSGSPPQSNGGIEVAKTTSNFRHACKVLGLDPRAATKALHDAKGHANLSGADNCLFDLDNGNIFFNEEWIGNLHG